jgi:hypothetical protein
MKNTLLIIGLIVSLALLGWMALDETNFNSGDMLPTKIEFPGIEVDMGLLEQGHPQSASFQFHNNGENPLIIHHIETSCGCTEPAWPKQPIKPGRSGEIKVTYDAKYPGRFVKTIKVFCNSEKGMEELRIKGEVVFNGK